MNWKKKATAIAAMISAVVIGSATSAFADGPAYPTHGGGVKDNGFCAYNWDTSNTQGYPGWEGKNVFLGQIDNGSAALSVQGCHAHVQLAYVNSAGTTIYKSGSINSYNGGLLASIYAGYYKSVKYVDFWVDGDNGTIPGSTLEVDPYGNILVQK
ncbi:hypothetical protein POF50_019040 [Streptomyces sp. SL13]|uniref:Uncharacterized protein n=1 Tax=Streptantibioticus silvisoli TaxID=2705255 RepID=A0AA90H3P2_9ACTN|nr:hypothetical protein [Streptantibioticus silvisoli]MDI5971406.1 hypothetical protein [Streptantibioticus silvisoli]